MWKSGLRVGLGTLFIWIGSSSSLSIANGADLRSPFEGLPETTRIALRMDNSEAANLEMRENTALGDALFSDERIDGYKSFVSTLLENEESPFYKWVESMEESGIELDDLYGMVQSKAGAAMADVPTEVGDSMPTLYAWVEMEGDLAEKLFESALESAAEGDVVGREDEEIAGELVIRVRNLNTGSSYLLSRLENRILYIIGMPTAEANLQEDGEAYEAAEEEAMGYFIQGQRDGEGGFIEAFYSNPGIARSVPETESVFEIVGDLKYGVEVIPGLLRYFTNGSNLIPADPEIPWRSIGGEQLKHFGLWMTMDSESARSKLFIEFSEPRLGVLSLMEQEAFEFQPEPWVPADLKSYSVMSFDMGKAYEVGLVLAKNFLPADMVESQLSEADEQLGLLFQTSVEGIAAAFGNRIHVLEYEPEVEEVKMGEVTLKLPKQSMAFVVDFANAELIENAFAMFGVMGASQEGSGMALIDEQGFVGVRVSGGIAASETVVLAYGGGRLVLAIGSDTASQLFSVLNTPPEGSRALQNDERFRDFMSSQSLRPAALYSYSDGGKVFKGIGDIYESLMGGAAGVSGHEESPVMTEFIGLFPSEEEMEEVFGALFSSGYTDEYGFHLESLSVLK